ncbi:MAG: succinylglutamate desuccinylase/aspartoacylase family protein, partial [Deltaproteobacteria bacterium]|nr:succinylglutamate desuccinylase/aspartoacylase family protein [Deltaproteobacteria bacterium]
MKEVLEVGDTRAEPGKIAKGSLGTVEIADSSKVSIPLININGAHDGPILTVVSGVHGPELSPIGAVLAAVKKIDPASLRGAFICIPGANPLAFRNASYTTPIDNVNLSGPWFLPPVDQTSASITQRMAFHINEALEVADYVLDMHANPLPSMPFVLTNYEMCPDETVKTETQKIAEAFGVTIINNPRKQASSLRDLCVRKGKPALTPELAGNIYMWDSISNVGTRGILNVMKAIG